MMTTAKELAGMIDHTNLKPQATRDDIKKLCMDAKKYGFRSVCVNPVNVWYARKLVLEKSPVMVCSVCGFPLGATTTETKMHEARKAVGDGASEIDMVMNIGAMKAGDHKSVESDIQGVVNASGGALVKVIMECCLLTEVEKKKACEIVKNSGASFVKTSTGFSTGGATAEDVRLMRDAVGPSFGVKAAGGIKTLADAQKMVEAGANRLGTSASVAIIDELVKSQG